MATHSSVLAWRIPGTGLVGCHLWGHTESDMIEATQQQQQQQSSYIKPHVSSTNISIQNKLPISFMVHTLMVNKLKFRKLLENYEIICCCNNFHYLSMFKIVRWGKYNGKHLITITKYILCHIYHCSQNFLVLKQDTHRAECSFSHKQKNHTQNVVSELPIVTSLPLGKVIN